MSTKRVNFRKRYVMAKKKELKIATTAFLKQQADDLKKAFFEYLRQNEVKYLRRVQSYRKVHLKPMYLPTVEELNVLLYEILWQQEQAAQIMQEIEAKRLKR